MTNFFEVKKVVGKRVHKNKTQYKIEWVDDTASIWVNESDCQCDRLIKAFEITQLDQIIGKAREILWFRAIRLWDYVLYVLK